MEDQRILRLLRFILAAMTLMSLCFILLRGIEDPDFFWHLATGRWIVENRVLPSYDPFNYTTPEILSSRAHFTLTSCWLSQILYYGIYDVSKWNGFILLRFIILGIIIYFVYKRTRGSDSAILLSVTAITMVVFARLYPFERPQVFSFLFFAILLYLLDSLKQISATEQSSRQQGITTALLRYCSIPLLMLIWANMHGGYIVGQGVIAIYLISEGIKFLYQPPRPMDKSSYKSFLITGITGILSAQVNSNTFGAITEMWSRHENSSIIKSITEYQSSISLFGNFYTLDIPVYWSLLFIAAVSLLYMIVKKKFDAQDIVMFAGLGYFSFTQVRYIAFFMIWAAPFIAISLTIVSNPPSSHIDITPPSPPLNLRGGREGLGVKQGSYIRYISVLFSLFIIVALTVREKEFYNVKNITIFKTGQWVDNYYPEDAANFVIGNHIKGNMYNFFEWGGYLMWKLYPNKKVFVDGRNLYWFQLTQNQHILNASFKPEIMGKPYYKAILESYNVRYMVIPLFSLKGEVLPIVTETINDKEWAPVFFGDNAIVFVKDTPDNYDVVHKFSIPKDIFVDNMFRMLDNNIKKSPGDFRFCIAKGDLYQSRWRFKEAKMEYEKALEINPFNDIARKKLKFLNMNYTK